MKRLTPLFKIHKDFQLNTINLITSMTPINIEASFTLTSHQVNQTTEGGLGYWLPLLLQLVEEVVEGGGKGSWAWTRHTNTPDRCSMGFMSGEGTGQSILVTCCSSRNLFTTAAR